MESMHYVTTQIATISMGEEGQLSLGLGTPVITPTCDNSCWFSTETVFLYQSFGCMCELFYSPVFSIEICWGILLLFISSFNDRVGG